MRIGPLTNTPTRLPAYNRTREEEDARRGVSGLAHVAHGALAHVAGRDEAALVPPAQDKDKRQRKSRHEQRRHARELRDHHGQQLAARRPDESRLRPAAAAADGALTTAAAQHAQHPKPDTPQQHPQCPRRPVLSSPQERQWRRAVPDTAS